ncbi:hypothetical protein Tsubulata_023658 [Turnera subulata]|uniref:Glycosyl transferase family 1 domain-containing protein n=1 Tax=Turnera subulata TaxID=218843 RepID=A0A9Q0F8E5_9ROSI|nr:hypothetical protein Tsubulata_023658 [Turnera subulata]
MESHNPNQSQPNNPTNFTRPRKKPPIAFYLLSILILLLAISLSITKTSYFKTLHLRSTLTSHPITTLQKLLWFLKPSRNPSPKSVLLPSHCVLWMAPFLSGGGYSSEAWSYILALNGYYVGQKSSRLSRFRLSIEQHGDLESLEFWEGLPEELKNLAFKLHQTQCRLNETVVVCHSEPGAWNPPLFETLPCPPAGYEHFMSVIGRTMFETDRVNADHVKRCNRMDYVWVPTDFHVSTFVQSGVDPSKVVKVVQPVDVEFFDPLKYEPLNLGLLGDLVLGTRKTGLSLEREFVFLSVFKWEFRKGWDVLLKAYLTEFSGADAVALYLLTNPYHSDRDFGNKIVDYVENSGMQKPDNGWPPIYVIDTHIAHIDLPRMYKAANAFILPSRGEGWGRPIVEAMSMSLPVITTNWSGPVEYLTEENGYPLPIDRMTGVTEGPFKGHFWAEPSVEKLRALMRHVLIDYDEAKARGRRAREDMIRRFSPEIVAGVVTDQIHHILDKRRARNGV